MEKLDVKDRKILYQLDLNSRQSFSQIGKKVGLHKDVVAYRVNRLQEKGIIKNYYTAIDACKLGYTRFRFYLTYQYTSPEIEEEIIECFVKSKYARFVHSAEGQYNLVIVLEVKDLPGFYYTWQKALSKYRDYFANQVFSIFFQQHVYRNLFLLDEKTGDMTDRIRFDVFGGGERIEIDDLDFQMLQILSDNARIPTIELAEKLGSTAVTINNRINKLMKSGLIEAFMVNIDFSKLGYQYYKADIVLKEPNKLPKIIDYIEANPNLNLIIKAIGYVDIELVFRLKSANRLHQIMRDLSIKFPDAIKNYTYFSVTKTHKWNYVPEDLI